jgi:hypothetical protein
VRSSLLFVVLLTLMQNRHPARKEVSENSNNNNPLGGRNDNERAPDKIGSNCSKPTLLFFAYILQVTTILFHHEAF